MTVAARSNLSRHRGLFRWALGALIVAGIGAVTFHGFGWRAWGFEGSGSPARVVFSYFQNGVAMVVLGIMACWAAAMPIIWVVGFATWVRRAYRSVDKWCRRVRQEGLNPSLAVALPWLAATALIAITIAATGGIQGVSFWLAALFSLGVTAFITIYVAAWTLGILRFAAEPAAMLLRPVVGAIRSEVRERISVGFNVVVVVGIAGAIYSGIGIQLDAPPSLRLPLGDPVLGSFSVFVAVAIIAVGLSVPIKRFGLLTSLPKLRVHPSPIARWPHQNLCRLRRLFPFQPEPSPPLQCHYGPFSRLRGSSRSPERSSGLRRLSWVGAYGVGPVAA